MVFFIAGAICLIPGGESRPRLPGMPPFLTVIFCPSSLPPGVRVLCSQGEAWLRLLQPTTLQLGVPNRRACTWPGAFSPFCRVRLYLASILPSVRRHWQLTAEFHLEGLNSSLISLRMLATLLQIGQLFGVKILVCVREGSSQFSWTLESVLGQCSTLQLLFLGFLLSSVAG